MNPAPSSWTPAAVLGVAARLLVGAHFVHMGLNKALDPVAFLKLVHEYELVDMPLLLNLIAAILPWFEVFCGVLLALGVAARGTAMMLVAMLVPFTALVLNRALDIHAAGNLAFCAIKFDCGCGAGEVFICRKLLENTLLTGAGVGLMLLRNHRLCLRAELAGVKPAG